MTMQEISERYRIPMDVLKEYEKWGLHDTIEKALDKQKYDDQDIEQLSMIMTLRGIGFETEEVKEYMYLLQKGELTEKKRLSMLNKKRSEELDEIHFKETQINQLDYLRYTIRSAG